MPSYILKTIATGHACCFDAPNDFVAREKAYSELRQIALALYPPSTNSTYAIRRRITGSLTLDYTSRTTMDGMLEIVRGFDFDIEDFGEDSSVEGYVEFLYEPVEDLGRMERLRAALPEHAGLHSLQEGNAKARISFIVEGHEYDPPNDDAVEILLEVLLSDEVPRCTASPVRGEGECNGEGHDLWAPLHIVGGHEANPGVFGLKDGVLLERKVCLNCACTLETTIHPPVARHFPAAPECEIRVLPPSDASTAWAKGKREEFRRMQPVPFTVGDLERILDFVDLVRAGNTDVMHLEDEAQAMWNWLLSYMPPSPLSADDGKI